MPIPFTIPSPGVEQPVIDTLGNKTGTTLIQPPDYYGTNYMGKGALTIPGVTPDPWGYNKTMTNIVSDPFNLGVNNFSGLNADQQSTARTVQDAFNTSLQQHGREMERYSMPALASFGEDAALARARTSASLINANQQAGAARNAYLDAMNKHPTTMQNIAGLMSLLGGGMNLFGGGLNLANQSGLLDMIKKAIGTPISNPLAPNQVATDIYGNPTSPNNPLTGGPSSYLYGNDNLVTDPTQMVGPPSDTFTTPLPFEPPITGFDLSDQLYG